MKTWEYKVVSCRHRMSPSAFLSRSPGTWILSIAEQEYPLAKGLEILGDEGWELAGVQCREMVPSTIKYHRPDSYYIFKRQVTRE